MSGPCVVEVVVMVGYTCCMMHALRCHLRTNQSARVGEVSELRVCFDRSESLQGSSETDAIGGTRVLLIVNIGGLNGRFPSTDPSNQATALIGRCHWAAGHLGFPTLL